MQCSLTAALHSHLWSQILVVYYTVLSAQVPADAMLICDTCFSPISSVREATLRNQLRKINELFAQLMHVNLELVASFTPKQFLLATSLPVTCSTCGHREQRWNQG